MDIKLIPKEYKPHRQEQSEHLLKIKGRLLDETRRSQIIQSVSSQTNMWLIISLIILVLTLLVITGLFFYNETLKKDLFAKQEQLNSVEVQRDRETENKARDLDKAIQNMKKFLDLHIYPSKLLEMIEELTLARVSFSSFDSNLKDSQFTVSGQTMSYSLLAQQLMVLEKDPRVKKIDVSGIKLDEIAGRIKFSLNIEFEPSTLRYEPAL